MLEKISTDNSDDAECKVCSAHATGFHFNCQSCGACAAFFRRAVVLSRTYRCLTGNRDCRIFYKNRALCKACRYEICLKMGMATSLVQMPKENETKQRSYFTKSGLKRNKRFSSIKVRIDTPPSSTDKESAHENETLIENENNNSALKYNIPIEKPTCKRSIGTSSDDIDYKDVLSSLIQEEMRIAERRRILFCEKPVANLLGLSTECPFNLDDLRPLKFRNFRKSLRIHILLIHEWIRSWAIYNELEMADRITFFRKCALYHTILDPCFISLQVGDKSKFVLQNGGYVSFDPESEDGWQDEADLSKENKKKIYWALLNHIRVNIIEPMCRMKLSFEEFVALKAMVSIQMSIPDISKQGRTILKGQLDRLLYSLFNKYLLKDTDKAERFGNIVMLLNSIFETGNAFVERHHQVHFFDIWQMDMVLIQFLQNKV